MVHFRLVLVLAICGWQIQSATEPVVSISAIMLTPERYKGKQIRAIGMIKNTHLGSFLEDETGERAIRFRLEEKSKLPVRIRVTRDRLYDQFWAATHVLNAPAIRKPEQVKVELIGIVHVNTVFDPRTEGPVEFIPLRVLSIERKPGP